MLRQTLNENLKCIRSIGMALFIATTLLVVMTGSAGATALPVNAALPCATNFSGCLNGSSSVQVLANTCINFYNTNSSDTCDSTLQSTDRFLESAPSDLATFPALNTVGTIKDLVFMTPAPLSFMTIGSVTFDLTGVIPSALAPCPNSGSPTACSIGVFSLNQTSSSQVTVTFNFSANACTGGNTATGCTASGGSTPYLVSYTSQLNNQTILGAIAQANSSSGITNAVSFTANPIPEPTAFLLIGVGLVGLGLLSRRRVRSRA